MNEPDPAQSRFFVISAVRMGGVLFVMLGILIIAEVLDLPKFVGYIIVILGVVEFFVMPLFLARMWRTPPE